MPEVVLITGCSTGIGRALANVFHEKGYKVFATARKTESLKELADQGITTLRLDVNDDTSIADAVSQVEAQAGNIDYLINNAGVQIVGPMVEVPMDDLRTVMNTNVVGLVAVTQKVVPNMIKRRSGTIVNISSVVSTISTPFAGPYCASKAAVNSITDAMRIELQPFGVRVLAVCPGAIKSEINRNTSHSVEHVENSKFYKPFAKAVQARGDISQQPGCTDTKVFATNVVEHVTKQAASRYFFFGSGAWRFKWILRWLPYWISDWMLAKKFGLSVKLPVADKND